MDARTKAIKRASVAGMGGNALLSGLKIFIGSLTGSMAVLADGIDSAADILTSLITYISAGIASKPPDCEHAYGHSRAETLSTKLLSFFLFFAGAQLALTSINTLIEGKARPLPSPLAFYVTLFSIFIKILLAIYKMRVGKRINSRMLIADGKNMAGDVIISTAVLIALGLSLWLKQPIIDVVIALLVSLWIMRIAYGIFKESNTELMEGIEDQGIYKTVFDVIAEFSEIKNPHKVRVRKMNNDFLIDIDIEVDPEMTVRKSHILTREIKQKLRNHDAHIYDVMIHVEPWGNQEDEPFGLNVQNLKESKL